MENLDLAPAQSLSPILPKAAALTGVMKRKLELPKEVPQGGPLPKAVPQGGPLPKAVPQGGPLPKAVPQGGPLPKAVWGEAGRDLFLLNMANRVAFKDGCLRKFETDSDRDIIYKESKSVASELYNLLQSNHSFSYIIYCFKLLRREIVIAHPDFDKSFLPSAPNFVYEENRKQAKKIIAQRCDDPIIIDSKKLIPKLVEGVRDGIRRKQCPQVIHCLNYLVALRPNDLNEKHERINANITHSNAETHQIPKETFRRKKIVGSLLNLVPSKATSFSIKSYSTVFICNPEDYPLMEEALNFINDPEIVPLDCTRCIEEFKNDVPSGPPRSQEWGSPAKGIMREMIALLGFNECVESWGCYHGGLTRQLGRSFVACCVEQGRFKFSRGLRPYLSVELLLGHVSLSTENVNYLKMDVLPEQVKGVTLQKVSNQYPIYIRGETRRSCDEAINSPQKIEYGVCLTLDN